MYAVAGRGGRIAPQVAVIKALASALCIGGGGSVGREGPIVQIGSALGSTLGRLTRVTEGRMRILVACGAAGGIAATFNAPLAGVFFAMELILRDFSRESFGMVVVSSVTASVIGRAAFGDAAFLHLPPFAVTKLAQYLLFAVLGVLAAGGRGGVHPGAVLDRRRLRLGLARPGVAAPGRRRHPARRASCSSSRRCTGWATRCWATGWPASTPSRSCSPCWPPRCWPPA